MFWVLSVPGLGIWHVDRVLGMWILCLRSAASLFGSSIDMFFIFKRYGLDHGGIRSRFQMSIEGGAIIMDQFTYSLQTVVLKVHSVVIGGFCAQWRSFVFLSASEIGSAIERLLSERTFGPFVKALSWLIVNFEFDWGFGRIMLILFVWENVVGFHLIFYGLLTKFIIKISYLLCHLIFCSLTNFCIFL